MVTGDNIKVSTPLSEMSIRPKQTNTTTESPIEAKKTPPTESTTALRFRDLTPMESRVVALGADPDAICPLPSLNEKYYQELTASKLISPELSLQLEAYKEMKKMEM